MPERFPRAYVNTVKRDEIMEYVPFETMHIGARTSGLPNSGQVKAPPSMSLDHVGGTASGSK